MQAGPPTSSGAACSPSARTSGSRTSAARTSSGSIRRCSTSGRHSPCTTRAAHFSIEVAGGGELEAQGDILNHEYEIKSGGQVVATVSKRWFTIRDTYGIAIAPGQDTLLLLCAAVCIDELSEADRR
jgi:hypothetical protein